jgi:tetratricopeptide (TPR) repeat protein
MMNTSLPVSVENNYLEPFEDRIDILFHELELATKWQRPSVLLAVYSSEYVRADADIALENRLHNLGQSAYHIKIKNQAGADVCTQISELANLDNLVFFVEGLRWGAGQDASYAYQTLNNRREYFIENQIRVVLWLTEKEAIDLAHYAPDYWSFRHRVIEFVDSPKPDRIPPHILESAWQWTGDFADTSQDLDAKIALRTALLTDLPTGNESTGARANLLLTLGILHWRRGDYERAAQFLNTAVDLAAMLGDNCFEGLCFNAIALVQTDLGRIEEAIQAYQNAISLAPEQISPWNNLGHLYKKLGRHAEALAAFQKAIEQNGSDAVSWNGLGDLYHETGRNDDAIYAYLKANEFSPDYAPSWSGLGNSYMDTGQLDEALDAHQKAIQIDRRTVNSWLGLGKLYIKQANNENASMAFRTALEMDPKNALAWNELGNLLYHAGAIDEAMRSYQKSVEFNQGNNLTYNNLASIYLLKGLHAEALPLLLRGLEFSNDKTETASLWNRLGYAYRRLNDYENAVAAYRKADAIEPESASPKTELSAPVTVPQPAHSEDLPDQTVLTPEPESAPAPQPTPSEDLPDQPVSTPVPESAPVPQPTSFEDLPDQPVSHPEPESAPVLQSTPLEGLLTQPASDSEPVPATEEPLPSESSAPALTGLSDETSVPEDMETDSSTPDADFVSWLDGLASVLPVTSPAEITSSSGSSLVEGLSTEDASGSGLAADDQSTTAGEPNLSTENGSFYSSEFSPEDPDYHILSDLSMEGESSAASGQTLQSSLITEEGDTDLAYDDQEEKTVFEENVSQVGHPEGKVASQPEVTIDQKNAQIWNELGNIYYNTGAFEEAMHAFEMAIELDPSCGWSYNNLASVYFHQKRYSDAIPLYQKGLQFLDDHKDKAVLWNRLGDAYKRSNKHDQAVAAYRKAIELDPDNVSLLTRARFSLLGNLRS